MPPQIALILYVVGILAFLWMDRDRDARTSWALWIPTIWFLIASSRMVSQWLSGQPEFAKPEEYLEGSPLDRNIFTMLIVAAIAVLISRGQRSGSVLVRNWPILLFFMFCLISATWSDFPFVAFKRWTKAVGNFLMVMVVVTDPNPRAAVHRLLVRSAAVLVPVSVLFIKYYPEYGRGYLAWVWTPVYVGVGTTKNALGYVCLICGLASYWRLLEAFRTDRGTLRRRRIVAHVLFLALTAWLFNKADSSTSLASFGLGVFLMTVAATRLGRRPVVIHVIAVLLLAVSASVLSFDATEYVTEGLGRDASLSGRTELWRNILDYANAPWLGTGFESFWLGRRSEYFWKLIWWHPNQAHNGYLETYINLGWVGIGFLAIMIVHGYRTAVKACRTNPEVGPMQLAYVVVALAYNLTEAAFKGIHPVWITFLLGATWFASTAPQPEYAEEVQPNQPQQGLSQKVRTRKWAPRPRRAIPSFGTIRRVER